MTPKDREFLAGHLMIALVHDGTVEWAGPPPTPAPLDGADLDEWQYRGRGSDGLHDAVRDLVAASERRRNHPRRLP